MTATGSAGERWASTEARKLWQLLEPIHAVTYFSEACGDRYRSLGLRGFWMGYFASRSAPFGEATPELVTATFFNFRPSMAARALPDAWALASPAAVLDARLGGSVDTLGQVLAEKAAGVDVAEAAELAEAAVAACPTVGRPLFAALTALGRPAAPLGRLWHAAVAEAGLVQRGWIDAQGDLTEAGRAGRRAIEDLTDDLAAAPWAALGSDATARLHRLLLPRAQAIAAGGAVPFPNPIGVPDAR